VTLELLVIVAALPVLDWAARWQVENAFAFGLGERRRVPAIDFSRLAILVGIGAAAAIIVLTDEVGMVGVVAIVLVVAYFLRLAMSAKKV
jgi:hypothetical protein